MDPNTSLSQLIADGLVIQTEFSSPKKRQTHSPAPSSRRPPSAHLPKDPPSYKSPVKDWKVHALNYEAVRTTKVEDRELKPDINSQSKKIWTKWKPESVEERLTRLDKERKQRLLQIINKSVSDKSAEFDFTPKINEKKGQSRSPEAASLHLYESGLAEIRRKQQAGGSVLLEQFSSVQENPSTSHVSQSKSPIRRSLNLFSKAKIPLRDFLSRNYWAPLHKIQRSISPNRGLNDSECVFRPQINHSLEVSTNTSSVYERLTSKQRISREKVYEKCRNLMQTEASQCTFQPFLYPRSKTPPPANFATRKKPLNRTKNLEVQLNSGKKAEDETGTTAEASVRYTDSRLSAFVLVVGHCSGDWRVIQHLEDIESQMFAFGMTFK